MGLSRVQQAPDFPAARDGAELIYWPRVLRLHCGSEALNSQRTSSRIVMLPFDAVNDGSRGGTSVSLRAMPAAAPARDSFQGDESSSLQAIRTVSGAERKPRGPVSNFGFAWERNWASRSGGRPQTRADLFVKKAPPLTSYYFWRVVLHRSELERQGDRAGL